MSHQRSILVDDDRPDGSARTLAIPEAAGPAVRRPHVCFVSMDLYPIITRSGKIEFAGGGEVQQAILARALRADGFRVSVLTADHGQPDIENSDGVEIHHVPVAGSRGLAGSRFLYPFMADIVSGLKRIDPDVVYFRVAGFRAAAVAWYARRYGKRFVYACASDREFQNRDVSKLSARDHWLFHLALRSADGILVQNKQQQDLLRTTLGRQSVIVPNCYFESDAQSAVHAGPVIWVGTFKPIKRPELFIDLARKSPCRSFVMVGGADRANDPGQAFYLKMRDLALEVPNLRFVGYVPFAEIGLYFDRASLLVNTSDSEGFPNTFLQAWIRGVPTLSFVCPQVTEGEVGTIACRDIDDMSTRITALTVDAGHWSEASVQCRQYFEKHHTIDTAIQKYRSVLRQLCGHPH